VSLALDKGTLDALDSREEQHDMLVSVARALQPGGVLVSVSFASAGRVLLLRRAAASLGFALSLRVVDAKPEVRLVAVLGRGLPAEAPDDGGFTAEFLDRLLYSGPLRSESLVRFEHAAVGALEVEQEELAARRREGGGREGEDSTGAVVWPAAHSTAAHLCANAELVRGRRVVELGAGTGLVGLVAAALGAAEVALTDLPSALPLLERNARRNEAACGGRVKVRELSWGSALGELAGPAGKVVLACEVVYQHDEETSEALVETMAALAGQDGLCLVSYEFRDGMLADIFFFDKANELFEVQQVVPLSPYGFGLPKDDDARLLYVYRPKGPEAPPST